MPMEPTQPDPPSARFLSLRKARQEARERFLAGRKAEKMYVRQLRQVAEQIDHLVRGMAPEGIFADVGALTRTLARYAETLQPWAQSVAGRMIADVSRRDATAWEAHGRAIGQALRKEIDQAPTGALFRKLLDKRVKEITSLPREAAERLFRLTTEGMITSTRAKEVQQELLRTGEVTVSRAKMLARTAVSTTATGLTLARAAHIGCEGYLWRTSKDGAVRPSHKKMEGKFVLLDKPPTLDNYTAHAGQFANCRCFCEPVLPDRF